MWPLCLKASPFKFPLPSWSLTACYFTFSTISQLPVTQKTLGEIERINCGFGRMCAASGKAFPSWGLVKVPWARLERESLRGSKVCVELVGVSKKKKKKEAWQMIAPPKRSEESRGEPRTPRDTDPEEKVWVPLCQQSLARAALQNVLVLAGPESSWETLGQPRAAEGHPGSQAVPQSVWRPGMEIELQIKSPALEREQRDLRHLKSLSGRNMHQAVSNLQRPIGD